MHQNSFFFSIIAFKSKHKLTLIANQINLFNTVFSEIIGFPLRVNKRNEILLKAKQKSKGEMNNEFQHLGTTLMQNFLYIHVVGSTIEGSCVT